MVAKTKRSEGTKRAAKAEKPLTERDRKLIEDHADHHYGTTSGENMTPRDMLKRARHAARLQRLTKNNIHISFQPGTWFSEDHSAKGHLYGGWPNSRDEWEYVTLDDRKSESLEEQLANELIRIGNHYCSLASKLKAMLFIKANGLKPLRPLAPA